MAVISGGMRAILIAGASLSAAACMTYPSEPRYSTHAAPAPAPDRGAYPPANAPQPSQPYRPAPYESPPPATAPIGQVEGGALPPPVSVTPSQPAYTPPPPPSQTPAYPAPTYPSPTTPARPGAAYVIQPGDTISGVGRRFQTPVQTLIDLNGLGPRGAISSGQRIILPEAAVDTGRDPYATGASPVGVLVPNNGVIPPPPPPPSGNAALPVQTRPAPPPAAQTGAPVATATGQPNLLWPVRGDIVRRFGPVGMGERNNGINIGASAGATVSASAPGRVAYVGSDLVGQGLTVLIVHANGWRTVYGHLGSATVKDGDDVRAGQQIGTVGLTAGDGRPSIHFETRQMRGDDPVAVDPLTVLPR